MNSGHRFIFPQTLAEATIHHTNPVYIQPLTTHHKEQDVDMQRNIKKSVIRKKLTKEKVEVLRSIFEKNQHVDMSQRKEIAAALDITAVQVKTWFNNRRVKYKNARNSNIKHTSNFQ